jgi:hypothetical protein
MLVVAAGGAIPMLALAVLGAAVLVGLVELQLLEQQIRVAAVAGFIIQPILLVLVARASSSFVIFISEVK